MRLALHRRWPKALLAAALWAGATAASARDAAPGDPIRTPAAAPGDGAHDLLAGARAVTITGPDGRAVETCADPVVVRNGTPGQPRWVMMCTSDPLHADDRQPEGGPRFRRLPTFVSDDLHHWRWHGEALPELPPQAAPHAGLWAPELVRVGARWHLYYAITDTADALSPEPGCSSDSAIGVAVADSPLGPWTVMPQLVVPPRRMPGKAGCEFQWTIDPDLLVAPDDRRVLYVGSYGGGIFAQPLAADGIAPAGEAVRITAPGRYEGAEVVHHRGWYWLFVSTADCCRGPLTGYAVFAGRSRSPLGPFVDRDGRRLDDARAGGTPVIVQDGGRWVGPGHNSVFSDDRGRWWTMFHAIDRHHGWIGDTTLSRRPALLGELRWGRGGWPVLAGVQADPAPPRGTPLWADGFDGAAPAAASPAAAGPTHARWQRLPPETVRHDGVLRLPTQAGDLWQDRNDATLPLAELPADRDLVVTARVRLVQGTTRQPDSAVQAGIAIRRDDDAYAKLVILALDHMQVTEFGVEHAQGPGAPPKQGRRPRFGSSFAGAPGAQWTELRLHLRHDADGARLRACSRADEPHARWICGATWVHEGLSGAPLTLALVAMGGAGHEAWFDRVAVHAVPPPR
jgi:arabinan endo-1,5-alpha-L-arabinosidase